MSLDIRMILFQFFSEKKIYQYEKKELITTINKNTESMSIETIIEKLSKTIICSRSLTILSHGYLLPQLVLNSVFNDINLSV